METRRADDQAGGTGAASALVCGQASRTWRRHLGALAWAALEELALTARHDDQGWASPADIRAIAAGIGTTDPAALRALAALGRAGLVALEPVTDLHGHRRCGYRLYLPQGVELRHCPDAHDVAAPGQSRNHDALVPRTQDGCLNSQDHDRCSTDQDGVVSNGGEVGRRNPPGSGAPTEPPPHHRSSPLGSKERP